jgi:predicted PurR-regulated permease PerM
LVARTSAEGCRIACQIQCGPSISARPRRAAQSLAKPALTVGKGAASIIIELFTLFVLVLLLLLEGPKMWNWTTRSSISSVLC